ncbi:MAG: terpene cyclase/mutase family protein [Planctomycetia bacterium]|nr:terpene cyclase/mutase family protein [Planctomycetia bacterium]
MRSLGRMSFLALVLIVPTAARGEEIPKEYQETVKKGLAWMAKSQFKDGHWEGVNGQYSVSMTALGGMSLLCEGSTIREGKYRDNIRRAANWLMDRVQPNGLIGVPGSPSEGGRYMYGHGFALLFLSCVVGEEENARRREKLVGLLEKAAKFTHDAQTNRGGWGYVSAKDGSNFDEGSVTITQVQALRAARNAGIIVPNTAIKMAQKYLVDSTDAQGGVQYSLAFGGGGGGRPALTAAAVSCGFSYGDYQSDIVRRWLKNCQNTLSIPGDGRRMGHDEYTHYYYAQVVYVLGEDRFKKIVPESRSDEALTWSKYRKAVFDDYKRTQSPDGSWGGGGWGQGIGPVYVTAMHLTVLQLDRAALPIYQR